MKAVHKYALVGVVAAIAFGTAVAAGASSQTLLLMGVVLGMVLMHTSHGHGGHGQDRSGPAGRSGAHDHTKQH